MSASGKQTKSAAFDAELNGQDVCIEFERTTAWSTDYHYGADADGNRSVVRTEIDEDAADDILVTRFEQGADGHKEISTPLAELPEEDRKAVEKLVDDYLEKHEPDPPDEDDGPEYEPEDEYDDADDGGY